MVASEWKRKGFLGHFTVVRKLDGGIFPMGLSKEVTERNSKAGSNILTLESRCSVSFSFRAICCYSLETQLKFMPNILQ